MKMNNNNNNELEQDSSSNKCIIELSSPLSANELDFLTLYLESRKQSGGGDIKKVLLNEDSTQMTVFYEGLFFLSLSPISIDLILNLFFFKIRKLSKEFLKKSIYSLEIIS
jgi:hypothetical protein